MVGYGSHTRVPHMSSPLFRWLAYWIEVTLPTVYIIVLIISITLSMILVLILIIRILLWIWNG